MSKPFKFGEVVWVDNDPSRRGSHITPRGVPDDLETRLVAFEGGCLLWVRAERLFRPGDEKEAGK